jgi:ribosomal protein S18 acetylase RimI-like enzyme
MTLMKHQISELQADDKESWQQLYYAYARFYKMPMDQSILDSIWSWIFDQNNKFYALIAKDEKGEALGFMHFRAMPSPLRGAEVGFLDDLYVVPEARGMGVVDSLYQALNAFAQQQDWPFVRWITAENNYRGRSVYDKIAEKTQWVTYQMAVTNK